MHAQRSFSRIKYYPQRNPINPFELSLQGYESIRQMLRLKEQTPPYIKILSCDNLRRLFQLTDFAIRYFAVAPPIRVFIVSVRKDKLLVKNCLSS